MDAPQTGKAPKEADGHNKAREARLAQALRANLRRRKASEAPSEPPAAQGAQEGAD